MNMEAFQVLLMVVLSTVVDEAGAQSFHMGSCPLPPVQQDFNVSRYMGTWYEVEKLPAVFERGTCQQATYTLLGDDTVNVRNAELLSSGQVNAIEAVAKVENTSQPAILAVSFFKGVPDSPYWVLSTDYLTSSLVYSCFDYLTLFHIDYAWILARTRALPDHVVRQHRDKLAAAGIRTDRLTVSNQTGCDALP